MGIDSTSREGDGRILADAILALPKENLSASLALLQDLTLYELLGSKAKDLWTRESGAFASKLDDTAKQLAELSAGELVLRIFGVTNEILDLEPRHYAGRRDFADNAGEIICRCLDILREAEKDFYGNDLQAMVRFQFQRMFGAVEQKFGSLSPEEQTRVVEGVRKLVEALPLEQQDKLRKELKADDLSDSVLRQALTGGAMAVALASAVSSLHFAFYTGAVSLLHGLAGLVGLTLPFAVYVHLASLIAVFSNPLLLVPVVGGGGAWLYRKNNSVMRQRLVPLVVTQMVAAHLGTANERPVDDSGSDALQLWAAAWENVGRCGEELKQAEQSLAAAEAALKKTGDGIASHPRDVKALEQRRQQKLEALAARAVEDAATIASGGWGEAFIEHGQRIVAITKEIDARLSQPQPQEWWRRPGDYVARGVATASASVDRDKAAKELAARADELRNQWHHVADATVSGIFGDLREIDEALERLGTEATRLQEVKAAQEATLASVRRARDEALKAKGVAKSAYWGLEKLV